MEVETAKNNAQNERRQTFRRGCCVDQAHIVSKFTMIPLSFITGHAWARGKMEKIFDLVKFVS